MQLESIDTQDRHAIGENIVERLQSLGPKLSWPAIYKSFCKTDAPSLVILDLNFITVPESTQKMALKFFTMFSSMIATMPTLYWY